MNVCKDLPPEYLIPGQLPDGSRIKGYMEPTSLLAALNEDQTYSDDDEEVGDIDWKVKLFLQKYTPHIHQMLYQWHIHDYCYYINGIINWFREIDHPQFFLV